MGGVYSNKPPGISSLGAVVWHVRCYVRPVNLRVLILLAVTSTALAQETAPLKLTLHDAVALALKQNPEVILANLGVSQSQQDRQIAHSALLPQVSGNVAEAVHRVNLQ